MFVLYVFYFLFVLLLHCSLTCDYICIDFFFYLFFILLLLVNLFSFYFFLFFFSSRRRHTRCALVTGVQTCALPISRAARLRILTAVREGPQGARTLNARIEDLLAGTRRGAGPASAASRYFHGRLLLVTENSYRHRLFNGDIGICLRDESGTLMAWFPGDDPRNPRPFHPAALPAHDSAFAMTVHKAQGSEFDEVWLVLPERFNRVLSRELVYTGMTRARSVLHVAGSADVIADALARHAGRWSGLGWRLR